MTYDTMTLTDAQARVAASWWHSGQTSSLYSLSSTGCVDGGAYGELNSSLRYAEGEGRRNYSIFDIEVLRGLILYVEQHEDRPPVEGWHLLWDDAFENLGSD